MVIALKTVEWAQVAGPCFAAFAATASWLSVRQSRRAFKIGMLPRLSGEWISPQAGTAQPVTLEFENTGPGTAFEPHYYLVSDGIADHGRVLASGSLRAGEKTTQRRSLRPRPADETVTGVLVCLDWSGRWHAWSWDGVRHRELRRPPWRRRDGLKLETAFRKLYGRRRLPTAAPRA